jgi:hypothetical protein
MLGCKPDPRIEEARLRALDSLREKVEADSLLEASINASLQEPLRLIDQPRLDNLGVDCFRVMAVFSWGVSPVGPLLSIRGCREGSNYVFTVHTFEAGKDPNDLSQRRRKVADQQVKSEDFSRIEKYLDSVGFETIPHFEKVDYSVTDAGEYFIERYKNGRYYCVIRNAKVDPFVFGLFAEVSEAGGIAPETIKEFRRREAESRHNSP